MRRSIIAVIAIVLLLGLATPARADNSLMVYYAGDKESGVYSALELTGYTLVSDPAAAQVFVLNGEIPDDPRIAKRIKSGDAGVVLILRGIHHGNAGAVPARNSSYPGTERGRRQPDRHFRSR